MLIPVFFQLVNFFLGVTKNPAGKYLPQPKQQPPKCAVLELKRDHNNKTLNTGIKPSWPKGSCNLKTQQNLIFKNTPRHYFKISFVIQAGGSGAGRILAHTVFVLKTRRVQDLCSTSSQVTLSSFGFIYKRNAFSLRGAAEKQLYAPAPESSSDEETPTPEASRDAATWSTWQDGEGHCEQTGDGSMCATAQGQWKRSSETNPQAESPHESQVSLGG